MSATVFIERSDAESLRLGNDTGANMARNEFGVVGGFCAVAEEAVASAAAGAFRVEHGIICQAATFVASEDTFATVGAPVFWDPVSKKFSDTNTSGYHKVGKVTEVKSSAGTGAVVRFAKLFLAEPAGVVKVARVIIDAATDYSTTGKSVPLPVGSRILDVVAICTASNALGTAQLLNGATALHTALVMAVDKTINRMSAAVDDTAIVVAASAITIKTTAVGDAGIVHVLYM